MSSSISIANFIEKKELKQRKSEPKWLQKARENIWAIFQKLPYESDPNMLNLLRPKLLNSLEMSTKETELNNPVTDKNIHIVENTTHLFCSPNKMGKSFSNIISEEEKSSISFLSIIEAIETKKEVKLFIENLVEDSIKDKLLALILSTFEWGSYTNFSDQNDIINPVVLSFENEEEPKPGFHIINVGSNVNVTLDLNYLSGKLDFDHSFTLLVTGPNSHVNILVSDHGKLSRKTNRGFISKLGKDSSINFAQIQVDGQYIRQRSEFYFTEEGGDLVEIVCLRGHKSQYYDFFSGVYHSTPKCTSNTIARGVNDDESSTIFKGKVDIGAKGAKVNTNLSLRGLLLSKKARFHSLPAMEVINNNVIATHGAAVSKIDPEQIFYFQTRGIEEEKAEYMIASGYFEPAVSKMRSSYLQDKAKNIISIAVDEQYSN